MTIFYIIPTIICLITNMLIFLFDKRKNEVSFKQHILCSIIPVINILYLLFIVCFFTWIAFASIAVGVEKFKMRINDKRRF